MSDFSDLMSRVQDGSDDAAQDLVRTYGPHVFRAVRRRLDSHMRSKFDSSDFVQAVWKSFFSRPRLVKSVHSPGELAALLTTIARNKVIDERRKRYDTQAHLITREQSDTDTASNAPSPAEIAIARERWRNMLDGESGECFEIIRYRLSGETMQEIANRLGVSERTVRRTLKRLLAKLDT